MLNALTIAEVQALRLMLHDFADRQSDQVVKSAAALSIWTWPGLWVAKTTEPSANSQRPSNNSLKPCKVHVLLINAST